MDINAMNSVSKVAMPAQKTELNKPENNTVEPQKDGNKKLALALTALAATAAAGVGIAVAAKKGKIHLPTFKKSAQNIANDTIKALPSGADDAIKALPSGAKDVADDAAKAVKEGVEKKVLKQPGPFDHYNSEIKRLQNELKDCKYPKERAFKVRSIFFERSGRWLQMEEVYGDTLSEKGRAFCRARSAALEQQGIDALWEFYPKNKMNKLLHHLDDASGSRNQAKMHGLMKELTKYTGKTFDTPEQAIEFAKTQLHERPRNKMNNLLNHIGDASAYRDENGVVTAKMKGLMKELTKYTGKTFDTPEQAIKFAKTKLNYPNVIL